MLLRKDIFGDSLSISRLSSQLLLSSTKGKPISVELPASVEMTIIETEPGLKSATVSNVTKPAKMETGLVVRVPPFINQGERIRISTSEGTYLERA